MTLPYDEHPVAVRCPRCRGLAWCEPPFRLHNLPKRAVPKGTVPEKDGRKLVQWGGWWVEEKFPSIITWRPPSPSTGYYSWSPSVIRCTNCHLVGLRDLEWPADAYFQWRIHDFVLWAWSEEHARVLLDYIASGDRDPEKYPRYAKLLRKLPALITAAKARSDVVHHIRRSLERN